MRVELLSDGPCYYNSRGRHCLSCSSGLLFVCPRLSRVVSWNSYVNGRPDFDVRWLTTNLIADDVVFGAGDKLRYAIEEAERRYSPKAIFVLTSCTTGIIGEDIEGVVNDLQGKLKAKIVPVHCEGCARDWYKPAMTHSGTVCSSIWFANR